MFPQLGKCIGRFFGKTEQIVIFFDMFLPKLLQMMIKCSI